MKQEVFSANPVEMFESLSCLVSDFDFLHVFLLPFHCFAMFLPNALVVSNECSKKVEAGRGSHEGRGGGRKKRTDTGELTGMRRRHEGGGRALEL